MQTTENSPVTTGKDIGLLFKPELIRSLLRSENPKTQTRRIINPQPVLEGESWIWKPKGKPPIALMGHNLVMAEKSPYQIGDLVYVKESLYLGKDNCWRYATDDAMVEVDKRDEGQMLYWAHHKTSDKHNALFMPKFAARIWREITDVRVQRIADISQEDAIAEGIDFTYTGSVTRYNVMCRNYLSTDTVPKFQFSDPRDSFWSLWNSINGKWSSVKEGGKLSSYQCHPWNEEDVPPKPLNAIRKDIPCVAIPNPWVWCLTLSTVNCDRNDDE